MAWMTKRKLREQIIRLNCRVEDLEERLCPCEDHNWVRVGSHFEFPVPEDIQTVYHYKCLRCGKYKERGRL